MKEIKKKNYPLFVAGKEWIINEVSLIKEEDSEFTFSFDELEKINKTIFREICLSNKELNNEEFEFVYRIAKFNYKEITEVLKCSSSTITKWKKVKYLPYAESILLKRLAYLKVFLNKKAHEVIGHILTDDRTNKNGLKSIKKEVA
jgi:DNA-binding transcriptional regulator YiaG